MILIYPPVSKGCEPPAGVALLAGALKAHNIPCTVIDANIEGLLWLSQHGYRHHLNDQQGMETETSTETETERETKWETKTEKNQVHPSPTPDVSDRLKEQDSWTRRALGHLLRNLDDIRDARLYKNIDRYRQRLMDINRVISTATDSRFKVSLADFSDEHRSPLKSEDLLHAAENYRDSPFYPYFESRLARAIEKDGSSNSDRGASNIIGISLCYLNQAVTAFALIGWIKARFPEKRIVMGGGLVSSWMSNPDWHNPFGVLIDHMVKGRGEEALIRLAGGIPKKYEKAQPDFEFCHWEDYLAPGRVLPFRTADGCYWRKCRFCPERAEGRPYHPEKGDDLIHGLDALSKKHQLDYIHFIDDAVPPTFLRTLVKSGGIKRYGNCEDENDGRGPVGPDETALSPPHQNRGGVLTWYGFVRFTKELADPQFCKGLYDSGCRMLKLGLESGDQLVLDHMEKGTQLQLASQALKALHGAGILTYVYLLFGTEFENEASAHKTLAFVKAHIHEISFLNLAIFNLPRFSEDAQRLETDLFYVGDLSLYLNFKHPSGWGRREIRRFLDKTFKKDRGIAAILKVDPPFFTSNHAMFMINGLRNRSLYSGNGS